jgi:hypothetical protein
MTPPSPFRTRTAILVAVLASASLLTGLALAVFGDPPVPPSTGTTTYSSSAIGHRAFMRFLDALGIPVLATRGAEHLDPAGTDVPLGVFLEPPLDVFDGDSTLADALDSNLPLLIALPKWTASPHPTHPGHIGALRLLPEADYADLLAGLGVSATLRRLGGNDNGDATDDAPIPWQNALGTAAPALRAPQVLEGLAATDALVMPLVWSGPHVLVARLRYPGQSDILLVSDPDIFSNAGLDDGDNAALALAIVEAGRNQHRVVAIDETAHGHSRGDASIWSALARFPLALVLTQALLLVAVVLWHALPRATPLRPAPLALGRGKTFLIASTAGLLRVGTAPSRALSRYFDESVRAVADALHAPTDLRDEPLHAWLAARATARPTTHDVRALAKRVADLQRRSRDTRAIVRAARAVHRWRVEALGPPAADPAAARPIPESPA